VLERTGSAAIPEKAARTRLLVIGASAFALVLAGWLIYSYTRPGWYTLYPTDLGIYNDGGLIVRHISPPYDGKLQYPLYNWHAIDNDSLQFTYTPFAALCFAVVSFVPWSLLPRLFQLANLIFLLIAAWFTMDALGYSSRRVKAGGMLAGAAAGLLTEPVFRTMFLGQINLFLMALIVWDLRQPDHRWWKGFGTGIAAGIKLIPIVFVPYMLLARRFREAALTVVGAALTILIGFVVVPSDSKDFWLHGLLFQDGRTGFAGWTGNQSLHGLVTRLAGSLHAATIPWAATVLVATAVGIVCAAVFDRAGHRMLAIVTTSLVGLLDSPISWDHHWVWVVPGMMVAAHYAVRAWRDGRRRDFVGCLAVAAALLLVFAPWPGKLWGAPESGPSAFTYGLIWAGPSDKVSTYVAIGDQPWFKEYHWTVLQSLAGNAYVLTGIAMLVILAAAAWRMSRGRTLRALLLRPRPAPVA
jgi:alpha-1,2-mannosyltransferase